MNQTNKTEAKSFAAQIQRLYKAGALTLNGASEADRTMFESDVSQAINEYDALNAVAEAAKPFERLKSSRSGCADAYHIATDGTAKHSIGQRLTDALEALISLRSKEGK